MPTWKERLHGRPGFLEEEDELYQGGAVPLDARTDPDVYHHGATPIVQPSLAREMGRESVRQVKGGIERWKQRMYPETDPARTTLAGELLGRGKQFLGGVTGEQSPEMTAAKAQQEQLGREYYAPQAQPQVQQPQIEPQPKTVGVGGAVPVTAQQPAAQPAYGAEGQAALTGMSRDEQMWVRQKALSHPNPNIRAWAKNWKDGGVVKEGDTTHVPVFDRNTGMPVVNPKTGEMEHISIARHGPKEKVKEKIEDPRIGIEARKLAAGKEKQMAGFGAKQAEMLYKTADELIKTAAERENPQENYDLAAELRGQADQYLGDLTGRGGAPAPVKIPTVEEMKSFTIKTDPIKLRITRKHFVDAGEAGKTKFQSLPRAAQKAISSAR